MDAAKVQVIIDGVMRPGSHRRIGGTDYITYEERLDAEDHSRVLMKLSGNRMEIVRSGAIRSSMIFEEGRSIPASYVTPYGPIAMEVAASRYRLLREENRILVQTEYLLHQDGEVIAQKQVRIEVLI